MNSKIKRKILSLVIAIILVPIGYTIALMGHNKVFGPGISNTIAFIIGILMICLGLYCFFDSLIGSRKNSNFDPEKMDATSSDTAAYKSEETDSQRQMRLLKDLYDLGILTEEQFSEKREKLLND